MKTAEERADEFIGKVIYVDFRTNVGMDRLKYLVRLFQKEEHKITRHSIAEELVTADHCESVTGDSAIRIDKAHNIAMNNKFS
jgi:hypothetical protein